MKTFICLHCGSINDYNEKLSCDTCKLTTDIAVYKDLLEYSKSAVRYGYQYRIRYENDLKKYGKLDGRYSLIEPSNYYDFLAAAVIAGAVGNLAYDLLKLVAEKVYKSLLTKNNLNSSQKELIRIIHNERRLNKFNNYILDYNKKFETTKVKVRQALVEEIQAEIVGKHHKSIILAAKSKDLDQMAKLWKKIFKEVELKINKEQNSEELNKLFKKLKRKLK